MTHRTPVPQTLLDLRPALAHAAQTAIDAWEQDADGWDETLGSGGACDLVAQALVSTLVQAGIEAVETGTEFDGGHAFAVALVGTDAWSVDVPARVYETGYGYVWCKKADAAITPDDLAFGWVESHINPDTFDERFSA